MEYILISIAGIIGTGAMTLFLYFSSYITSKQMKVVKILGTMLTNQVGSHGELSDSRAAITIGTIVHYAIGVVFGLCYLVLWKLEIGDPNLFYGFIFGLISGIIGFSVWKIFFTIHPQPPLIDLNSFFWNIIIGHIILGIVIAQTFLLFKIYFID